MVSSGGAAGRGRAMPGANAPLAVVIDDDPACRRVVVLVLRRLGCRVLEAADGLQGLELLRRHRAEVALVVTDRNMPGLDGLELLERVRAGGAMPPALLLSGDLTASERHRAAALGAQVLDKPFELVRLQQWSQQMLLEGRPELQPGEP